MAAGDISDAMVARVRARLGDEAGTMWADSELFSFLNEGIEASVRALPQKGLLKLAEATSATLTNAVNFYALPTDFEWEVLVLYKGTMALRVEVRDLNKFRNNSSCTPSATEPYYYVWKDRLNFQVGGVTQAAAETYELWYVKRHTAITTSVDPELGREYDTLIENYAVAMAWDARQEPTLAAEEYAFYLDLLKVIRARFLPGKEPYDFTRMDYPYQEA